jgi:hypothetical protein
MKLMNFFLVKKNLPHVKRQDFYQHPSFLFAFHGLDNRYLWSRNRNRDRNLSKVGAGTVTFQKSEPEPEP